MIWPFGELLPLSFDVICADPPWDFTLYSEAGAEKSASAQYETMSLDAIRALPVHQLARGDCLLLMWGCTWMAPKDRQSVVEAWGFTYKTELAWSKVTRNGKRRMGPGYRARTMHETIYLATIGNPIHKAFHSLFDGVARQHSRKPEEFYSIVERYTPTAAARLDLFSRQTRPGWASWGREARLFDDGGPDKIVRDRAQPLALEPMTLFPDHEGC